jgi:ElaB/YqjD/DUF883 family membrane-anchored ribosome-binding protein
MDAELEALVKSLDAFLQATGAKAKELEAAYESKLDQVIERNPNVSKHSLN